MKYITLLRRLLAPAPTQHAADVPRVIRSGRVLSNGSGR